MKVDPGVREVTTELGDKVKYDVLNLIPPQRAGTIAVTADLVGADKRWCEVNHQTYESVKHKNIHVIGDSTIGLPVPKSGNIANAMGKISAVAVASLLNDKPVPTMAPGNTCYSWVSDREAIAVVNSYKIEGGKVVQIEQKLTPGQSRRVGTECDRMGQQHLARHARRSRRMIRTHLLRWRPRRHAHRTVSTPRVPPSGAASQLGPSHSPATGERTS